MKNRFASCILSCFIFSILLSACTTTGVKQPDKMGTEVPAEVARPQVYTKEQRETLDIFTQILEIYESAENRQAAAQEAEVLYARIITEYPDTPLAQEGYWKLITISVRDYSPPAFDKAEAYYNEFMEKYPGSVLKNAVDQTLMKGYSKHAEWERLMDFCAPAFMAFKEESVVPLPMVVFMYGEANYRLGNIAEAEEAFKTAVELYPGLGYGKMAKKRLEEIARKEEN